MTISGVLSILQHRRLKLVRRFRLNPVSRSDVLRGLRELGVREGDEVMFHSGLAAMGYVEGGADTVIDAFLDAVGPEGTVLAPSFSVFNVRKGEFGSWWDPASTPVGTGSISERFWRRPGALRSDHPTHAVAAIGRRAAFYTCEHGMEGDRCGFWGTGVFGSRSPWEKMVRENVHYLFLGCTFQVCTLAHHVESCLTTSQLQGLPPGEARGFANALRHCHYAPQAVWPDLHRLRLGRALDRLGLVRHARMGYAHCLSIRAQVFFNETLKLCRSAPRRWLARPYLEWIEAVERRKQELGVLSGSGRQAQPV